MEAPSTANKRKREEQEAGETHDSKESNDKKKQVTTGHTFTITFGDQAENHAGMQILGEKATSGFSLEDLETAKKWFEEKGVKVEIHHLNEALPAAEEAVDDDKKNRKRSRKSKEAPKPRGEDVDAYVLVARKGLEAIVGDSDAFHAEQAALQKDAKAKMYGRVVEKRARHNLCFCEEAQAPDYVNGKGTIVAFDEVPLLKKMRASLADILGEKAAGLVAEGNYYYDISKCGIGFHGDAERCKVVAVRTGAALPLHYQWFLDSKPVGTRVKLLLEHGDVYVMSEKAVGTDWKRRQVYTLRHAAGAKKFLTIKE